jgi:hypothetical protein
MVIGTTGLYLAVFILTTILVLLPGVPPLVFLHPTLAGLFVCGVCASVASAGIVGTAGLLNPEMAIPIFKASRRRDCVAAANTITAIFGSPLRPFTRHNCRGLLGFGCRHDDINVDANTTTTSRTVPIKKISWETFAYFLRMYRARFFLYGGIQLHWTYKRLSFVRGGYVPIDGVSDEWMQDCDTKAPTTGIRLPALRWVAWKRLSKKMKEGSVTSELATSAYHNAQHTGLESVQGPAMALFLTYILSRWLCFQLFRATYLSVRGVSLASWNDLFTPK